MKIQSPRTPEPASSPAKRPAHAAASRVNRGSSHPHAKREARHAGEAKASSTTAAKTTSATAAHATKGAAARSTSATADRTTAAAKRTPQPKAASSGVTQDSRFSGDFRSWLFAHGYGKYDFAKSDLPSFGGLQGPDGKLTHEPVIFIHGNGGTAADWNESVQYFESKGYSPSELYGMTWGDGSLTEVGFETHSAHNEEEVRAFIEAVKQYTGAKKVNLVAHSMGVTLARKAVKGGKGLGSDGAYNLGRSLTKSVDTFVGIAGANQGLVSAFELPATPAGNRIDGYYPGEWTPWGVVDQSQVLQDINSKQHYEGSHVFSIWSPNDEIINAGAPGGGSLVYGVPTPEIPGEDGEDIEPLLGHFGLLHDTAEEQYKMITEHKS